MAVLGSSLGGDRAASTTTQGEAPQSAAVAQVNLRAPDGAPAPKALGVMQVLPTTGQEMQVGDVHQLDPNIHAGIKYLRFMTDRYFKDAPMDPVDKMLFAFASYNAGPAKIARLRKEAKQAGLDPNVWFNNVERIAAKRIGRETVQYVSNIFKYYVAYRLIQDEREEREKAKEQKPTG